MAVFTDNFDGAAGALLSSRTGWAAAGGYYDVLKIDGAGALGHDIYEVDGKAVPIRGVCAALPARRGGRGWGVVAPPARREGWVGVVAFVDRSIARPPED